MDPIALAAALAVMATVFAAMMAVYKATAHPRAAVQQRLGGIISDTPAFIPALADEAFRPKKVGRIPIIAALLEGKEWTTQTAEVLERAELKLTVSEYVAVRVLAGLMLAMLPAIFIGGGLVGLAAMLLAGIVGFQMPVAYVGQAEGRRVKKLETQLPEALSLLANALKAGFGLLQSVDMASRQMEHPIATEFRRVLYDTNVGSTMETALSNMARRSSSKDLDIVITAMLVQQSVGGNLAEVLDNVAHTMRERVRIRGEIKTLTSQQMLTGFIIGGLPIVMALGLSVVSSGYMKPMLTSTIGHVMLIGAAMLEIFGIFIIRKILSIEV